VRGYLKGNKNAKMSELSEAEAQHEFDNAVNVALREYLVVAPLEKVALSLAAILVAYVGSEDARKAIETVIEVNSSL
jgi:hypothetical protein